jgi:hypothetical protein
VGISFTFSSDSSTPRKSTVDMASDELANALPGDVPGSDTGNPAGAGNLGSGGLESQVAQLAALVGQLMESRAHPTSPMSPPLRAAGGEDGAGISDPLVGPPARTAGVEGDPGLSNAGQQPA